MYSKFKSLLLTNESCWAFAWQHGSSGIAACARKHPSLGLRRRCIAAWWTRMRKLTTSGINYKRQLLCFCVKAWQTSFGLLRLLHGAWQTSLGLLRVCMEAALTWPTALAALLHESIADLAWPTAFFAWSMVDLAWSTARVHGSMADLDASAVDD